MGCGTGTIRGLSGSKECRTSNELVIYKGFVFATEDQSFATALAAGLKANWDTDIAGKKLFPAIGIKNIEDASKEAVIEEYQSGDEEETRAAKRGLIAYFNLSLEDHKILQTYADNFKYYYPFDEKGNIRARSTDGTIIKPIKISSIKAMQLPGGTGTKPLSGLKIIEADYQDQDVDGRIIQPQKQGDAADRWFPTELDSVALVQAEQEGTLSTNTFVVDINYKSTSTTDANGDPVTVNPVEGAVEANFTVYDSSDAVIALASGPTESATVPGRYTMEAASTPAKVKFTASSSILAESAVLTLV